MKVAKAALVAYLTCTDPVMITKWANILDSYWHKDEGKLVTSITVDGQGNVTIQIVDSTGASSEVTIEKYIKPNSEAISYIEGLQDALNGKVNTEVGKGLSTNDFTAELLDKLNGLQNYIHPQFHQIADVQGLQVVIDDLYNQINSFGVRLINYGSALFFQSPINGAEANPLPGDWALRVNENDEFEIAVYNGLDGSNQPIFINPRQFSKV